MVNENAKIPPENRSMFALTKVWFGFLLFALTINLIPYLPFFDEEAAEQALIVQFEHTSYCAPQTWLNTYPEKVQDVASEFILAAIPLNMKTSIEKSSCILPVVPLFVQSTNKLEVPRSRYAKSTPSDIHLKAHPERGPPDA